MSVQLERGTLTLDAVDPGAKRGRLWHIPQTWPVHGPFTALCGKQCPFTGEMRQNHVEASDDCIVCHDLWRAGIRPKGWPA